MILCILIIANSLNAGVIGMAVGVAKDKAKDKATNLAVDVYKARKEIRRSKEAKTGNKSLLSKSEDKIEIGKKKIEKIKNGAKETTKNAIGKNNLETLSKAKQQMKESLIGMPIGK